MFSINNYIIKNKNRISIYYKTLTLKKKVFIILALLVLLVSMLSFLLLQISYKVYDKQLINSSSEIINLYSTNVENELRKVDNLTFDVLTSNQLQNDLKAINNKTSSYERNLSIEDMEAFFRNQSQTEKYISSISYVDINGNIYTVGNSTITFEDKVQNEILRRVGKKAGSIVWIEPQGDDKAFILARKIRAINNLENMGTVIIRIDANTLVNWVSSMSPQYMANLIILDDRKNIIYKSNKITTNKFEEYATQVVSNNIYTINKDRFLINREVSRYTNWSYVYFMSYDNIFRNISVLRIIMAICFIIIFIFVVLVGFQFSESITNPIIILSKKMKIVQKGNFNITDMNLIPEDRCDEVGQLNNDFIVMINKINALIKENYIKQILVKETELRALQAQINPHFLYNTLDSINWLAKANHQDSIALMVKSLGNLFRSSITNKDNIITVEDELKLLNDYINIQKIRFEHRLNFTCTVDDDIKSYPILKLTLQPIVENSIKYGLETVTGICIISIISEKYEGYFEIIIKDNGPGISKEILERLKSGENISESKGIGLKNINERIKLFFGTDFGIILESVEKQGTTVRLRIPY